MERQSKDGTHALMRHSKDTHPALSTKTAKYISDLEYRIAKLESRNSQSNLPPKSSAALEFDAEISKFNDFNAKMDLQIQALQTNFKEMRETTDPYKEYSRKINASIQNLDKLQDVLQTAQLEYPAATLKARFTESENALSNVTSRLDKLEKAESPIAQFEARFAAQDKALKAVKSEVFVLHEHIKANDPPVSTHDLAKTLTLRLSRGDGLDEATIRSLRDAIDGARSMPLARLGPNGLPARLPETPVTDASASVENIVDSDNTGNRSAKRKRARQSNQSLVGEVEENNRSSQGSTGRASRVGTVTRKSQADTSAPRKSGRKPQPIQGYGGEILWNVADTSVRGFRRSIN